MKARHIVMTVALAGSVWLAFFGEPEVDIDIAEPVARPSSTAPAASAPIRPPRATEKSVSSGAGEPVILALQSRDTLIRRTSPPSHSPTLFNSHNWSPPPPVPVMAPPAAPAAPPLPFTYLGKAKETDQWRVFLSKGDTTLIVKESDVIDNTYRVETIKPPSMTLLYLPLNETQSLTIE